MKTPDKTTDAEYECTACKHTFSVEAGSLVNPSCPKCNHKYVVWLNYQAYVKQWA